MRALLTSTLLFSFIGMFAQSWVRDNSFDATPDYRDIYFFDANLGWIVGSDGVIYHTVNGGTTWAKQTSGVTDFLYSVYFLNQNQGWIAAGDKVLGTTNGGTTWQTLYLDSSFQDFTLTEVGFIGTDTGWVAGRIYPSGEGILLRSDDGGYTWNGAHGAIPGFPIRWFPNNIDGIHDMKVINGDSVVIAGGGGISDNVQGWFRSLGTIRWESRNTIPVCPLRAIEVVSGGGGWTTGKLTYYSTSNSFNWRSVNDPLGDEYWGRALHFSNLDTGWITSSSRIVYTTDRGATWTRQLETFDTDLEDIDFSSKYVGFAVGTDGVVYRYDTTSTAPPVSAPAVTAANPLSVYPNPATKAIQIYAPGAERIMIYNIQGALVYEGIVSEDTQNNLPIDVSTLTTGLYLVRAITNEQILYSGKFLKE